MLNEAYELVKEFQKCAGQPIADRPTVLDSKRKAVRYKWMKDELEEFFSSMDVYTQADAIMDLLYYSLGTLVELGVKPEELFILLHEYNIKKLENIIYDADGKVLKPEGWRHPDKEIIQIIDSYNIVGNK